LKRIEGRDNDVLYAPELPASSPGIDHIQRDVQNIRRLQVVQEARDCVVMSVLPTADYGESDTVRIEMNAQLKIPRSVSLDIRVADSLRRTSLRKIPFIIRSPDVDAAIQQVMSGSG
jgi:hypothetical protein